MSYDYAYADGDLVLDEHNEPVRYPGAAHKASRQLVAEYQEIDGVPVGNRTWQELRRETDRPVTRQIAARYCRLCLQPLGERGSGELADIEVETGDPAGQRGTAILSSFRDVAAGKADRDVIPVIPPWGS